MRIIHLSDLHLSNKNLTDLKDFYVSALIEDLTKFSKEKPIDIVLITGDLLDKGGESLGEQGYN